MGKPDQFVKDTFADETELITGGAMTWQDPPELRLLKLLKVQGDGLFGVHHPDALRKLPPPWSLAGAHREIFMEMKMAGDHVDCPSVQRAVMRRQVLWVQRVEAQAGPWPREEPLWLVAPHVPGWLRRDRELVPVGAGCYQVCPSWAPFLWVAANELPLLDELVPFLVARSGESLDEFARWVAPRRSLEWVLSMIESIAMSNTVSDELLRRFGPVDDPQVEARRQKILRFLLETSPSVSEELLEKGRLLEARASLRGVLVHQRLLVTPDDEAQIERCTDFGTLRRWMLQAITAATAAEALR